MTDPHSPNTPIDCFSTLGCPDATPEEVCHLATLTGTRQIELRCMEGLTDYPSYLDKNAQALASFALLLKTHSLGIAVVDSSYSLASNSTTTVSELLAACRVADKLKVRYVRVFGGGMEGTLATKEDIRLAVRRYKRALEACAEENFACRLLVETHMGFVQAKILETFEEEIAAPVDVLWDTHHTWKRGQESPTLTFERLSSRIRHIHCKDSRTISNGRFSHVPPGDGEYPFTELFTALQTSKERPIISLEWERRWHPEMEPLPRALEKWQSLLNRFPSTFGPPQPVTD